MESCFFFTEYSCTTICQEYKKKGKVNMTTLKCLSRRLKISIETKFLVNGEKRIGVIVHNTDLGELFLTKMLNYAKLYDIETCYYYDNENDCYYEIINGNLDIRNVVIIDIYEEKQWFEYNNPMALGYIRAMVPGLGEICFSNEITDYYTLHKLSKRQH